MRNFLVLPLLAAAAIFFGACSSDSQSVTGPGNSTHNLIGTITSVEQPYTVIGNARVQVTSGPDVGQFAQSDANGAFALKGIQDGMVSLSITKAGFQPAEHTVNLRADTAIFPKLVPMN